MVRIIVDSASDITQNEAKKLNVQVIPMKTLFGEVEYLDGITMNQQEFFERLIETDVLPTTSQNTPFEYEEIFREVKEAGDTAVCVTLSSKLSGCYQSAMTALDGYEDCIVVVDSENATIGERILTELAVRLRNGGGTAFEIAEILEKKKKEIRLVALLDTLEYLKKGGRISAATAFAGTVLSIKPVVAVEDGEVVMIGKARGSKNGNNMLTQCIEKTGGIDFDLPFCLAYSGLSDKLLKKYVQDHQHLYQDETNNLPVSMIGSTVGTHVGPGAIAVAFFSK